MGMFENLPYTNLHELNLDWIMKKIKELVDFKENDLVPLIEGMVEEAQLNLAISYNAETYTLKFTLTEEV